MLTEYIQAVMRHATYERFDEDNSIFGSIDAPGFEGVWANEATHEACEAELQSVLEDWILLGVRLHHTLPVIAGISLNAPAVA